MTENEAIQCLKNRLKTEEQRYGKEFVKEYFDDIDFAISALKEIQLYKDGKLCLVPKDVYSKQCCELDAYKEIGTVEECREAVEKQNHMEIKAIEDMCFECPKCKELVAHDDGWNTYNYCPNCGQKLSGLE